MPEITQEQQKKLEKLIKFEEEGEFALIENITELESKVEKDISEVKVLIEEVKNDPKRIPENGKDGRDGQSGVDGRDGLNGKDGRDGKDGHDGLNGRDGVDGLNGRNGERGNDGSPDTPDQVIEKVIESSRKIPRSKVEGLEILDEIPDIKRMASSLPVTTSFFNGLRAKNLNIIGGTATQSGDTVSVTIASSGGGGYTVETPSGALYDQNTGLGGITFTVTATPVYIVADGVTYFDGAGYTIAGLTITMDNPVTQYIRAFHT